MPVPNAIIHERTTYCVNTSAPIVDGLPSSDWRHTRMYAVLASDGLSGKWLTGRTDPKDLKHKLSEIHLWETYEVAREYYLEQLTGDVW